MGYLRLELSSLAATEAASALQLVCAAAEQGGGAAREVVQAFVGLLTDPALASMREELRAAARATGQLALERVLRRPFISKARTPSPAAVPALPSPDEPSEVALTVDPDAEAAAAARHVPDYGKGRPLTLGERKSLARRPPPDLLPRILLDPHPDVIRLLLGSPRLTEDDVVRLITRRPGRTEVLAEITRHPKWCDRPRVRLALVLQPATPTELAIALISLLRRHELPIIIEATALHPAVRASAAERFARLPPVEIDAEGTA